MTETEQIRNEQWDRIQKRLQGDCARVHAAWREFGPCTTAVLAERAQISLWNVRPRTTQLLQAGLVDLVGKRQGREGIYHAISPEQALGRAVSRLRCRQMELQFA